MAPTPPSAPAPLARRAHAKINLALAVGPPLPPGSPHAGYHPIASWMHAIDLADDLTVAHAPDSKPVTTFDIAWHDGAPVDWPIESDLTARAHRALEQHAARPLPTAVTLRKRIPAGGGLGGGSSDAAALLLALRDLHNLDITTAQLAALAHTIGTDIPYFIDDDQPPRPALVTGLGDRIERLPRSAASLTLILPPFGCPTCAVYRAFDAAPTHAGHEPRVRSLATRPIDTRLLFNDLADAALRAEPRLAELHAALARELGTPVHVSGSGSTLFCFAPAARVRAAAHGCRILPATLA